MTAILSRSAKIKRPMAYPATRCTPWTSLTKEDQVDTEATKAPLLERLASTYEAGSAVELCRRH